MTTQPNSTLSVRIWTDSSNIEQPTHRACKLFWKTSKERPKVPVARFISVPKTVITVAPEILAISLQQAFEDLQDNLIRSLVEKRLEMDPNVNLFTIDVTEIDEQRVADFAAETSSGTKLSYKLLEDWFSKTLSDVLQVKIAASLGMVDPNTITEDGIKKVEAAMEQYKTFIASLSAPKSHMPLNIAEATNKALSLVASENRDKVWEALDRKVQKFLTPQEITLAVNL